MTNGQWRLRYYGERQKKIEQIMDQKRDVPETRGNYTPRDRTEETEEVEDRKRDREIKQPRKAPARQGGDGSERKEGGS